jgi:hypothetical protein
MKVHDMLIPIPSYQNIRLGIHSISTLQGRRIGVCNEGVATVDADGYNPREDEQVRK